MSGSLWILILCRFAVCLSTHLEFSEKACEEDKKYKQQQNIFGAKRRWGSTPPIHHVVRGERAEVAEFSYMVAIGYVTGNNRSNTSELLWGCGGSLISDRYILTAAHCITDGKRRNMHPEVLRTGVNDLEQGVRQPYDYSIEKIIIHPQYRPDLKYFDLALLRTDRPVVFSISDFPICLADVNTRVDANTTLIVAGWGAVDPAGVEMSTYLRKGELRLIPLQECRNFYPNSSGLPRGLDENMICAAEPERKNGACHGDSGGPLAARGRGRDVLVGVTSFGSKPCAGRNPGVYASVQSQLPWIESVVWPTIVPQKKKL